MGGVYSQRETFFSFFLKLCIILTHWFSVNDPHQWNEFDWAAGFVSKTVWRLRDVLRQSAEQFGIISTDKASQLSTNMKWIQRDQFSPNNQAIIIHDSITVEITKSLLVPGGRRRKKKSRHVRKQRDDNGAQTSLWLQWDQCSYASLGFGEMRASCHTRVWLSAN